MSTSPGDAAAIRSAVRRNTIWAAGAAVIMLYYGLYHGLGGDPQPDLPARFRIGSWLVLYTLQIGGGLMVLSAVFSLTGSGPALLFDALASVVIGACLAAAGMLLMSGIEMQSLRSRLDTLRLPELARVFLAGRAGRAGCARRGAGCG